MQKTELMNQNLKFRRARETDWEWILTSSAPRSSGGSPKTFLLDNKASPDESTWKQRQNHPGDVVCCLTHNMLLLLLHLIEISFLPLSSSVVFLSSSAISVRHHHQALSLVGWSVCPSVRHRLVIIHRIYDTQRIQLCVQYIYLIPKGVGPGRCRFALNLPTSSMFMWFFFLKDWIFRCAKNHVKGSRFRSKNTMGVLNSIVLVITSFARNIKLG